MSSWSIIFTIWFMNSVRRKPFVLAGICPRPGGEVRQKILVFSPHPDDDVISMGGTLITLADQGHDVHVAYMTSGNIAVFDHDAMRHIDFVNGYLETFGLESDSSVALKQMLLDVTASRQPGVPDCEELLV